MDKDLEYISDTQTLIGERKRHLVDTDTGEEIIVDQVTKRSYGTKNFWKCYLMDFLNILGILESKQVDVFDYIAENTNSSNNLFIGTYDKIAKDTGVCRQTIAKIMKKLKDHNFIKRVQNGAWLVNPNILMKGNDNKRQILLSYYQSEKPVDEITMSRTKRKPIELVSTQEVVDAHAEVLTAPPSKKKSKQVAKDTPKPKKASKSKSTK